MKHRDLQITYRSRLNNYLLLVIHNNPNRPNEIYIVCDASEDLAKQKLRHYTPQGNIITCPFDRRYYKALTRRGIMKLIANNNGTQQYVTLL